ncbi:hypothetical protein SH661x_000134 [Planctomicrobium sp. SH661]|uniref:hypothetical protein n=1 Tax=Planctomicrobium sp. SH661 TaxID=3448124 RepID=UPI003F5C79A5
MMLHPRSLQLSSVTRVSSAFAGMLLLILSSAAHAEDAAELTKYLPGEINAVAVVQVQQILQTPRAQREEWAKEADERFLSGAGGIPSWVNTLVVGSLVRPAVPEEIWAAGVARVPAAVTIEDISQHDQVPVENLHGISVVQGRNDSYLLGVGSGLLGIWQPGIRQEAARWARSLKAKVTGPESDYLVKAAATPGHIVMAIDLEHALDPENTQAHLEMMQTKEVRTGDRAAMQALLMSLQGAILSVSIDEKTTATLRIDFQQPVGSLGSQLKPFFLNALNELGAMIDDFEHGEFHTDGNALVLTTDLSDESLRRLVSLITSAPSSHSASSPLARSPAPMPPSDPNAVTAEASSRYFRQVDQFVNDLSRASRRSNDYSRTAMWHEKFASRIDELPIQGVDPALVDYAGDVASRLRALGRSLRGQQLDVNLQQKTLTYDVDYNPGWASVNVWGGVGFGNPSVNVNSNLQQVRERQAAAISAGARQREEVWSMITEDRARVLRQMQQTFGPDFGRTGGRGQGTSSR